MRAISKIKNNKRDLKSGLVRKKYLEIIIQNKNVDLAIFLMKLRNLQMHLTFVVQGQSAPLPILFRGVLLCLKNINSILKTFYCEQNVYCVSKGHSVRKCKKINKCQLRYVYRNYTDIRFQEFFQDISFNKTKYKNHTYKIPRG